MLPDMGTGQCPGSAPQKISTLPSPLLDCWLDTFFLIKCHSLLHRVFILLDSYHLSLPCVYVGGELGGLG